MIYWRSQRWNDVRCEESLPYLCEYTPKHTSKTTLHSSHSQTNAQCTSALNIRTRWLNARGKLSSLERELSEQIEDLCPASALLNSSRDSSEGHYYHRSKLKVLNGIWTLDERELSNVPRFMKLPKKSQALAQGELASLQIRLSFGANRVRLITRAWDHDDIVSTPYTLISHHRDVIALKFEGDHPQVTINVSDEGRSLRITQGDSRLWLRRLD